MPASVAVQSRTVGIPGRYILSGQGKHMVVDASPASGGAGESFVAQELFVGALATCAQAIVHARGQELSIAPSSVVVSVESERDLEATPPAYSSVRMEFTFCGVTESEANILVTAFTHGCPIYHTVASATTMRVSVRVLEDSVRL
jgi:uncharacterized OsmC-like protein